jgi:hypothetical protein
MMGPGLELLPVLINILQEVDEIIYICKVMCHVVTTQCKINNSSINSRELRQRLVPFSLQEIQYYLECFKTIRKRDLYISVRSGSASTITPCIMQGCEALGDVTSFLLL